MMTSLPANAALAAVIPILLASRAEVAGMHPFGISMFGSAAANTVRRCGTCGRGFADGCGRDKIYPGAARHSMHCAICADLTVLLPLPHLEQSLRLEACSRCCGVNRGLLRR